MAQDIGKLVVQITADVNKYNKELAKLTKLTANQFKAIENQARQADKNIEATFKNLSRKLTASVASIGAALGTRELARYSDTWTRLGNLLASSSQATGMQARSLSELRDGADDARASLDSYAELYARIMRSTQGVAKSEEEVARATNIVSKAMKAGGAAASEQAAAVMQLGQALGSGVLQGDELRSLRENAPILAKAIADEFGVTIAGLKELGSQGALTSDRVFSAILKAQKPIQDQFAVTQSTIADGFTRIQNALTEFIGVGGKASGVANSVSNGLEIIADNFDIAASAALVLASAIATQLLNRSLTPLIRMAGDASTSVLGLFRSLSSVRSLGGLTGVLGGGAAIGGGAALLVGGALTLAVGKYMSEAAKAKEKTTNLNKELEGLGLIAVKAAQNIDTAGKSIKNLVPDGTKEKIREVREEYERLLNGGNFFTAREDELPSLIKNKPIFGIADTANADAAKKIVEAAQAFQNNPSIEQARKTLAEIAEARGIENASQKMKDYADQVAKTVEILKGLSTYSAKLGEDVRMGPINDEINQMIATAESYGKVTDGQKERIRNLFDEVRKGGPAADAAAQELKKMGNNIFELGRAFAPLDGVISRINQIKVGAGEVSKISLQSGIEGMVAKAGAAIKPILDLNKTYQQGEEYVKTLEKQNAVTKEQGALQKAIAKIKADSLKEGLSLTDEQLKRAAKSEVDKQSRWSAESKKPKKEKDDAYEKAVKDMENRIALIKAETDVQQGLNPFVNDYGLALEKARAQQELMNAAKKARIDLDKDQTTKKAIDDLATGYAKASAEAEKLQETQEKLRSALATVKDVSNDVTRTFIDGMIDGKSATEALGDAVLRLGQRLLDSGLDTIFDSIFKGIGGSIGGGGGKSGMLGFIPGFSGGGYTGGGGKHQAAGIVHKGEYVLSKEAVSRAGIGNLEALHNQLRGYANGGLVGGGVPQAFSMPSIPSPAAMRSQPTDINLNASIMTSVDQNGNLQAFVQSLSTQVATQAIKEFAKSRALRQIARGGAEDYQLNPRIRR